MFDNIPTTELKVLYCALLCAKAIQENEAFVELGQFPEIIKMRVRPLDSSMGI